MPTRIVVAGAGLAGLSAAHELARAGADVTIIDARERAGGRVWTVTDGFTHDQYGELGGEFIDEDHQRIRTLAGRFDLPLVRVLRGGFTHRVRTPDGDIRVSRAGPWEALERCLAPLIARYKAEHGRAEAEPIREMATYSLGEWLRTQGADAEMQASVTSVRGFFLAEADALSVLPVVAQLAESGSPAQTPVYRIRGGTGRLIDALVANTPARLLLRHQLRAVAQSAGGLSVHVTDETGRQQQIDADAVVAALPASTLRDVQITPALPEMQQRAIARLRYGRATKAVVQCASEGLRRRRAQAFATNDAHGAFWDATSGEPGAAASVIAFLAGGAASAKLRRLAQGGGRRLLSDLCWLRLADDPVVTLRVQTWEDDPLARGGYAYADPGFDPAWKPLLSRRAGRIVFAGEHTSADFQGYMEGAVQSGARAAAELLQSAAETAP